MNLIQTVEKFYIYCKAKYHLIHSEIFIRDNDFAAARTVLFQALGVNDQLLSKKTLVEIWYSLGYVFMKEEEYHEAIFFFDKITNVNPQHDDAIRNIGYCIFKSNSPGLVLEMLKQRLTANPNHVQFHFFIALSFEKISMRKEAEKHFKLSAELDPKPKNAYLKLFVGQYKQKNYNKAVQLLDEIIPLVPRDQKRKYRYVRLMITAEPTYYGNDKPIDFKEQLKLLSEHKAYREKIGFSA